MTAKGAGKRLAGSGVAVSLTGVRAIDRRLRQLEPRLQKKVMNRAMRDGMKLVQKQVKANARTAFESRTGATVRGVKVRAIKRSRQRFGVDVRINRGAYVDKTFYSAFLEWGTSRMAARPFMRPAYASRGPAARDVTMRAMLAGLKAQVREMAKGG